MDGIEGNRCGWGKRCSNMGLQGVGWCGIVIQVLSLRSKRYSLGFAQGGSYFLHREACCWEWSEQ